MLPKPPRWPLVTLPLAFAVAVAAVLAAACGEAQFSAPERRSRSLPAPGRGPDGTGTGNGPGQGTGRGNGPGASDGETGPGNGTGTGTGTGSGTATSGGDDGGSGGTGGTGSGAGGDDGSSGTGTGTGTGTAGGDDGGSADGLQADDEEIVQNLPGQEVVRLGVNFEDLGASGDKDFNDAVLCFEGHFKVNGSSVASIRNQQVVGRTSSISGCNHNIRVEIIHRDGTREAPIVYDSRAQQPVKMTFKVGSRLEVFMTPYKGCTPGVERNMHSAVDAKVLPNVCNVTGN